MFDSYMIFVIIACVCGFYSGISSSVSNTVDAERLPGLLNFLIKDEQTK